MLNTIPTHTDANSYVDDVYADQYLEVKQDYNTWTALTVSEKEQYLKQATRQIDNIRYYSVPLVYKNMYYRKKQNLEFPRWHPMDYDYHWRYVRPSSIVSGTTFASNDIKEKQHTPDDLYKDGAVIVTDRDGKGKTYQVASNTASTGEVTITETFDPAITTKSQLILVTPYEDEVKNATVEQAFFLATGKSEEIKSSQQGVKSRKIDDVSETYGGEMNVEVIAGIPYSEEAINYLMKYIQTVGVI